MSFFDKIFDCNVLNQTGITGLNKELSALFVYNTFIKNKENILLVLNSTYEANLFYNKLLNYTSNVLFFPMDDFITSEALAVSPEFKTERIITLNKLSSNDKKYIVVSNLMGVLRYLPSVRTWKENIIKLKKGMDYSRDDLIKKLFDLGYETEKIVYETGKIGIRGFVIDIFPIGEDNPIRIEFWGDTIDTIKYFDVDTQLATEEINNIDIFPFTEFLLDNNVSEVIKKQKYLKKYSNKIDGIWNYIGNSCCIYYDYGQLKTSYENLKNTVFEYSKETKELNKTDYMYNINDITCEKEIYISSIDNYLYDLKLKRVMNFESSDVSNYEGNYEWLKNDLEKYVIKKRTVIICFKNSVNLKRFCDYLDSDNIIKTSENNIINNKINLIAKNIDNGFIFNNYIVLSENNLFKNSDVKKYKNKYKVGNKVKNLIDITKGDYIVHEEYGIGIYDEICTILKNGFKKDYIKLIYAGGDILYVPVEKIDRISKFSGKEGVFPRLNKLGTDEWKKRKTKIKGKIEEIAQNILKVSAEREALKGYAFSEDDENQTMFDSQFEFTETADQIKAIDQIKKEMQKVKPMDMLLCGDVGFGKTEVAFRAMFKAVNDGKQVAYLCPTTILSSQQYNNALKRFSKFPVNIALLNRFTPLKEERQILENLQNGKIDILFGTHRILSKDVVFKDIGLLVIDEEQRFGVKHKETIKQYKSNIDVLTLSATPIPRTLQMSMTGIRGLALIETPPSQRFPIQTYVLAENKNVIKDAIYKELSRNGQTFLLYNKVKNIEEQANEIRKLVPEARVQFAHGQMTKNQLEDIMVDFINYKYDVLICTTIIETGIDIPNVNTLIIIDADRFGLAQLYQIRGRIGRSNKIGYAYLMYDDKKVLNELAIKRLNTIKEFTELGSGFKIAMRDLSIRGAGDILGSEQSGFIDTIGIELYLKLLNEVVMELKGNKLEETEEKVESNYLIDIDTHISNNYVSDDSLKIEIHKKINEIDSFSKMEQIKDELENRFGKISESMHIYMYEEWFEKIAQSLKIKNIRQIKNKITIELPIELTQKIDGEKLFVNIYKIHKNFKLSYKDNKIFVNFDISNLDKHFLIYLIEMLEMLKKEFT
mgnify:CR=1 FL=1